MSNDWLKWPFHCSFSPTMKMGCNIFVTIKIRLIKDIAIMYLSPYPRCSDTWGNSASHDQKQYVDSLGGVMTTGILGNV